METALKIAFATTDMETVNQHFGSAKSFAIYAVDMEDAQLLEAAQFGELHCLVQQCSLTVNMRWVKMPGRNLASFNRLNDLTQSIFATANMEIDRKSVV